MRISNNALQARLHEGPDGKVLWLMNQTRDDADVWVTLQGGPATFGHAYWGKATGGTLTVPARDIVVVSVS